MYIIIYTKWNENKNKYQILKNTGPEHVENTFFFFTIFSLQMKCRCIPPLDICASTLTDLLHCVFQFAASPYAYAPGYGYEKHTGEAFWSVQITVFIFGMHIFGIKRSQLKPTLTTFWPWSWPSDLGRSRTELGFFFTNLSCFCY